MAESAPPGWNRVKVSENFGATRVAPGAPVVYVPVGNVGQPYILVPLPLTRTSTPLTNFVFSLRRSEYSSSCLLTNLCSWFPSGPIINQFFAIRKLASNFVGQ